VLAVDSTAGHKLYDMLVAPAEKLLAKRARGGAAG
jgi:hypothetical protein